MIKEVELNSPLFVVYFTVLVHLSDCVPLWLPFLLLFLFLSQVAIPSAESTKLEIEH